MSAAPLFQFASAKKLYSSERVIADAAIHEVMLASPGPMYTTAKGFGDVEPNGNPPVISPFFTDA
jgi:hypothetical protein